MQAPTQLSMESPAFVDEAVEDLRSNVLPFWLNMADHEHGGFYGRVGHDGLLDKVAPKGSLYTSRILWSFSRAARLFESEEYGKAAETAYAFLIEKCIDPIHGGLFWSVDFKGHPVETRKMFYTQAFGVYALSEFYRLAGSETALEQARQLFQVIESRAYDPVNKGYFEGASRDWKTIEPMVLGEDEPPTHKSMNTHLHILEAYSNLLLAWNDAALRAKQRELIHVMIDRIIDPDTMHFQLYFDAEWNARDNHVSYGHDIEGSWLLDEAVHIVGDDDLTKRVRPFAIRMGEAVFNDGIDRDGIIQWEGDSTGVTDSKKYWWALAEQVVGFYNLYERTRDSRYLDVTRRAWDYIQQNLIDPVRGDWIWGRFEDGVSIPKDKAGIWKGPYHNCRMAFELLQRTKGLANSENQ